MAEILLVGEDVPLLKSRAAILARTRANVRYFGSDEMERSFRDAKPQVVIMCHSLSSDGARRFAQGVKEAWPDTHIVRVVSGLSDKGLAYGEDSTSVPEPSRLLKHVAALLVAKQNN